MPSALEAAVVNGTVSGGGTPLSGSGTIGLAALDPDANQDAGIVVDGLLEDITAQKRGDEDLCECAASTSRIGLLSLRERDVMKLVVGGQTNKSIANTLKISIKTVEMHHANLMKKLQVACIAELVRVVLLSERPPKKFLNVVERKTPVVEGDP